MSTPSSLTPHTSLRQRAYDFIQAKLLEGTLSAGEVVSEAQLAEELGISRTPVREAIRQFEQEGVLEQKPRVGTMVCRLDRRDLDELFELREALEPFAAGLAAGRLQPEESTRLRALVEELTRVADALSETGDDLPTHETMSRLLAADLAFHLLLLEAAGNRRLVEIVSRTRLLMRIFETPRQRHSLAVIREVVEQHRQILQAVQAGNAAEATVAMQAHIRASRQQALAHFDRRPTRPVEETLPAEVLSALRSIEQRAPTDRSKRIRDADETSD